MAPAAVFSRGGAGCALRLGFWAAQRVTHDGATGPVAAAAIARVGRPHFRSAPVCVVAVGGVSEVTRILEAIPAGQPQ